MAKNEIKDLLGFREFLQRIKTEVKKEIGDEYNVDINHVIKNNSIELDSLIILKQKDCITPNIYLNPFYERFLKGESIHNIVKDILNIYHDSKKEEPESISVQYELEEMKPYIVYRLIHFERNKLLLEEVPYIRFLDLAITFHCLVRNNEEGIGTIRITNDHIKKWNVDINVLVEYSKKNTPKLFPPIIKSMNEIILEIIRKELETKELANHQINSMVNGNSVQSPEELLQVMTENVEYSKTNTMYILSNTKGINGACCLLYTNIIKDLANELDADFYILPSSIHEIILVKDNGLLEKEGLKEMVKDVNRSQVPREEVLSDSVYYYSRERDGISLFH